MFNTYCAACLRRPERLELADAGVNRKWLRSLLTAQARGFSDGYLYSMVRYGRNRMPQYGDKIVRIDERRAG